MSYTTEAQLEYVERCQPAEWKQLVRDLACIFEEYGRVWIIGKFGLG